MKSVRAAALILAPLVVGLAIMIVIRERPLDPAPTHVPTRATRYVEEGSEGRAAAVQVADAVQRTDQRVPLLAKEARVVAESTPPDARSIAEPKSVTHIERELARRYEHHNEGELREALSAKMREFPKEDRRAAHKAKFDRGEYEVLSEVKYDDNGLKVYDVGEAVKTNVPVVHNVRETKDGRMVRTRIEPEDIPRLEADLREILWLNNKVSRKAKARPR